MNTAIAESKPTQRDHLIEIGDGQLNIPYSLAFDSRFNALDIRVWLAARACGERRLGFDVDSVSEAINASRDAIVDSISVLDMLGWFVVRFRDDQPSMPTVCAQNLNLFEILRHNPNFDKNLAYYFSNGSPRVRQFSAKVKAELKELRSAN